MRLDPADQLLGLFRALLVLDPGVEVFGVLADDDQVDFVETRSHARIGLARADLPVEVEALAEGDVHGPEADSDRCRDRPLEGNAGLANRVEDLVGQRIAAVFVHDVRACLSNVPVEVDARRLEDAAGGLRQLGAGSVAWDQNHLVGHGAGL